MKNVFVMMISAWLWAGCMTEVYPPNLNNSDRESQKKSAEEKEAGINQACLECFEKFKEACRNEHWESAYEQVSQRWQRHKSLQQFIDNMKSEGRKHVVGARVIQMVVVGSSEYQKCELVAGHDEEEQDVYLLSYDDERKGWKIDGLRIVRKSENRKR